jgi:hypothetical protein
LPLRGAGLLGKGIIHTVDSLDNESALGHIVRSAEGEFPGASVDV